MIRRFAELRAEFDAWAEPRDGVGNNPFRLRCAVGEPRTEQEVVDAFDGTALPPDLVALWTTVGEARLFEDVDYGQWGLVLLSPAVSAARTAAERQARPADIDSDDVVVGEFLGDQELLIRAGAEGDDGVLVALPLDPRDDWYRVGATLDEFLDRYLAGVGAKFWEATT